MTSQLPLRQVADRITFKRILLHLRINASTLKHCGVAQAQAEDIAADGLLPADMVFVQAERDLQHAVRGMLGGLWPGGRL